MISNNSQTGSKRARKDENLPAGSTGLLSTIWVIRKGASTACRADPPTTVALLKFDIVQSQFSHTKYTKFAEIEY